MDILIPADISKAISDEAEYGMANNEERKVYLFGYKSRLYDCIYFNRVAYDNMLSALGMIKSRSESSMVCSFNKSWLDKTFKMSYLLDLHLHPSGKHYSPKDELSWEKQKHPRLIGGVFATKIYLDVHFTDGALCNGLPFECGRNYNPEQYDFGSILKEDSLKKLEFLKEVPYFLYLYCEKSTVHVETESGIVSIEGEWTKIKKIKRNNSSRVKRAFKICGLEAEIMGCVEGLR